MNQECAKFIEQLSTPAESRSDKLVAHLANCESCRGSLATIQLLQESRMPLEASDISTVSLIANAPQVKAILSSSSLLSTKVLGLAKLALALAVITAVGVVSSISYKDYYNEQKQQVKTNLKNTSKSYLIRNIDKNSLLFLEKQIQKLRQSLQKSSSQINHKVLKDTEKLLEKGKEVNISFNELKTLMNSPVNTTNRILISRKKIECLALEKDFLELLNAMKISNSNNLSCLVNKDFPTIDVPATGEEEDAF